MRNRYIVYLLILFVFFGFVSCSSKKHELAPKAVKGVLNLSEWDFNEQGAISLNGEWEFYWNQFVTPSQFKDSSRKEITSYFVLPKLWNGYKINNTELSGKGYATYRLKLKLKDIHQILAFKINRIETAYEFWINNKLLVKSGTIGKTEEEMTPCWLPTEVSWQPDSTEVELVILISNFKHRKGGSGQNIELGLPSQIYRSANKMLGIDVFLLGVLLIMAFYHFGLFFLRKKDRSNLYFGLVCIFTSFYMMANGEFLLSRIYPDVNWQMLVKINFISNILRITFFILFISDLFKEIVSRKFVMSFVIWGGAMTLFFLVTPAKIYTHSLILIILIAVAAIIYILFIQLKSLIAKRDGAGLSFIGTLVLLIAAVNDTLHDYSIIHTFYAVPFGVFIFIFFQSFMLSLRSSRLFAYVENLSNRLLVLDKIKNDFIAASTYDLGAPLKVIVENIGVERGVLILKDDSDWFIVSQAKAGINEKSEVFEDFYVKDILEEESMFSIDVFSDVIKSKESVIVADINADFNYRGTKYFLHRKVRSVFCMPLFDKEEMKGVLYLEHSQESNVFNDERINVLELLSSQLTTLVDNVRIYQELEVLNKSLEQKVRERTQEVYQQKEEIEAQRDEIDEKNQELSLAMEELSIKNKDMTDSIKYAKRIQYSLLPSSDIIKKLLPQSFVL